MNTQKMPEVSTVLTELARSMQSLSRENPIMVGIHSGGVDVAGVLHQQLQLQDPLSTVDISFYRDDFTRIGLNPEVKSTRLMSSIDDRHVILVDDVLQTGRTIRAALNVLFDYGRPLSVKLAVLIERDGRELPIQPEFVGRHLELGNTQHIKLVNPDRLQLVLKELS